jgi:ribosomal protein RSM22 (predicted rRNA methylase)
VLSREPVQKAAARIIRQPQPRSGHVNLVTSEQDGAIHARTVSRKQGELFRKAKGAAWGDAL